MSDPSPADPAASGAAADRDDLVARLKAELAQKTAGEAAANARAAIYEKKEQERLAGYQPEAQYFLKEWIAAEAKEHHEGTSLGVEASALAAWADEFTSKSDIQNQAPLAAMSYIASKGVKRLREEASRHSEASAQLATALKENEQLKENLAKVQKDRDEAIELSLERQKGLSAMEAELQKAGLVSKFDFSKSQSREAEPSAAPAEPHAAAAATPALAEVQALASKSVNANPITTPDLLTSLLARANGGLKVSSSGTAHALLGTAGGDVDIASMLRLA